VLAKKLFVDIPGNSMTVLALLKSVLRVLRPGPQFIELAPKDREVLILLKGIGKIFDKELSADIVVLNEEVPSELKSVIVDAL
jgi:hypothetical protein